MPVYGGTKVRMYLQKWFEEIVEKNSSSSLAPIDICVSVIGPKSCNNFLGELKNIILQSNGKVWDSSIDLQRVHRVVKSYLNSCSGIFLADENHKTHNFRKNTLRNFQLEVLIGSTTHIKNFQHVPFSRQFRDFHRLLLDYKIKLKERTISSTNNKSHLWPLNYRVNQSMICVKNPSQLAFSELISMKLHVLRAIKDAEAWTGVTRNFTGVVIIDPSNDQIVSSSFAEFRNQSLNLQHSNEKALFYSTVISSYCTPITLSIEGVSRYQKRTELDSEIRNNTQYICTGYDVYSTEEPSIYESMALLHSRVRRVIFGKTNKNKGGLTGKDENCAIHLLKGTNHRYRVFHWSDKLLSIV